MPETRRKAFELIKQVMGARGEMSDEDNKRMLRVARLFDGDKESIAVRSLTVVPPARNEPPRGHPDGALAAASASRHDGEVDMLKEQRIGKIAASAVAQPPHSKYDRLIARAQTSACRNNDRGPPVRRDLAARRRRGGRSRHHQSDSGRARAPKSPPWRKQHKIDIGRYEIVDAPHSDAAAAKAVEMIHEVKGELLMKGSLHTDELMREVTSSRPVCARRGA